MNPKLPPGTAKLLEIFWTGGSALPEPNAAAGADDDGALLALAQRHGVLPWLGHRASRGELTLAPPFDAQARDALKQNAMRALAVKAALIRVHDALQSRRIDCLALKGIVLSQQLHSDISLRHVGDLDLLVDPGQLGAAESALLDAGLVRAFPPEDLSPSQRRLYCALRHEFVYWDREFDLRIELHWRVTSCASLSPGTFAELWERRDEVVLGDHRIPALGAEDLLLQLCVHGGVQAWPKLKWLADIAVLGHRLDAAAAERLLARARRAGIERPLLTGMALSAELLGSPLPAALQSAFTQQPVLGALTAVARSNLLELQFLPGGGGGLRKGWSDFIYRLRLGSRWRYRLESLLVDLVIPESVTAPTYARWPFWALAPLALVLTCTNRIRKRIGI